MSQYPSGLWAIALVIALGPDHAHASSEYGGIPQSVLHIPVSEGVAAPSAEFPDGTPEDYARGELPPAVSDFDEALARSYWTNPTLLAARSRLRSVDNRLPQARAAYGPKLGFETGYAYVRDQVEQSTGGHRTLSGWTSTASAILTQPVYSFGRNTAAERTALAEIAFEKAKLRSTETQTLLAAVSAFAGLIRDREAVRITADNLALLEREYNDNKLRFAQREVTSSDVHQVETRVEEGRARLFSAKRIDAASAGLFLATIGAPAADHLGSPRPLPIPITSLEAAYAWADQHNPVLRAAYAREKISRASRDAARANLLPRIDIRGSADYGSISPYNDALRQTQLRDEIVISGPIFESGLRRSRVTEAELANDADWRLIDAAHRETRAEVNDAWNDWLAQTASLAPLKASAEAAEKAFDGAVLQEKAGFRTTLDVLNLARELLVARSNYNGATASVYIAQARLLAVLGMLNWRHLREGAPAYDAEENFERVRDDGDIPLLTPLLRAIDGIGWGNSHDRLLRDPAATIATGSADLPLPENHGQPDD